MRDDERARADGVDLLENVGGDNNLVVIKTLKGVSSAVSGTVDKLGYKEIIGSVFGDETVMIICENNEDALNVSEKIKEQF